MRKTLILSTLVITSVFTLNAQVENKGDFNWGVTVGAGLSDIRMDNDVERMMYGDDKHGIANIQAGIVIDYAFSNKFFLESGISFQRKGFKYDTEREERTETEEISLDKDITTNMFYLQLPVLLNYKIQLNNISLSPQIGPYVAYGIGGKTKTHIEQTIEPFIGVETEQKTSSETNSFDENGGNERFDFGLRYAFSLSLNNKHRISLGYDMGLLDINRNGNEFKNKNGSLFATYTFFFK